MYTIDNLDIIINSGEYHNKDDNLTSLRFNDSDSDDEIDNNKFTFECNNIINQIKIEQKIKTEDLYSYYGNQDGFLPATISVVYNSDKYKKLSLSGKLCVASKGTSVDYVTDFDLYVSI